MILQSEFLVNSGANMHFDKKFRAIYADPPWNFKAWSAKGTGRGAVSHYDTMSFADICSLPVASIADDDCVLFLWAIDPMLPQACELIKTWGFVYKTVAFHWVKLNKKSSLNEEDFTEEGSWTYSDCFTGLGYWTRASSEICLLATRGKPIRKAKNIRRLIIAPRREHSRKPDEARNRIESLVDGPYLDMFCRKTKPGWDCWGDEIGLFDQGPVETRRQSSNLVE